MPPSPKSDPCKRPNPFIERALCTSLADLARLLRHPFQSIGKFRNNNLEGTKMLNTKKTLTMWPLMAGVLAICNGAHAYCIYKTTSMPLLVIAEEVDG